MCAQITRSPLVAVNWRGLAVLGRNQTQSVVVLNPWGNLVDESFLEFAPHGFRTTADAKHVREIFAIRDVFDNL